MKKEDLKYIQKELGFTVQQMADVFNVKKSTYEAWLYGANKIPELYEIYLKSMREALECSHPEILKYWAGKGLVALGSYAIPYLHAKQVYERQIGGE